MRDAEELHALEEWHRGIQRLVQHALVELQPGKLPVEEGRLGGRLGGGFGHTQQPHDTRPPLPGQPGNQYVDSSEGRMA